MEKIVSQFEPIAENRFAIPINLNNITPPALLSLSGVDFRLGGCVKFLQILRDFFLRQKFIKGKFN